MNYCSAVNIDFSPSDCHLRGKDLLGDYAGIASVRTMCSDEKSIGLVQDTGGSVQSVGATGAHELGHIFNMLHDDSGEFEIVLIMSYY